MKQIVLNFIYQIIGPKLNLEKEIFYLKVCSISINEVKNSDFILQIKLLCFSLSAHSNNDNDMCIIKLQIIIYVGFT